MQSQQSLVKQYQKEKEDRFQQSLFKDQIQNIDPSIMDDSNNPNLVRIILICTFTQDIIASKEKIICSESEQEQIEIDDVVEFNPQLECAKKEITVYVNRSYIEDSKLLKSNYIQKLDTIKLPICSANGIRIPNEYDIKQFFKFYGIKDRQEDLISELKSLDFKQQFGLLICSLIFQNSLIEDSIYDILFNNINLEISLKLLLISVQYESRKQHYLYKLLKHLYYFSKGLLKESYDTILQKITTGGMKPKQLQVEKPNFIKLITAQHIFKVNSTILYPLFKQQDSLSFKYYKPQREGSYYKVLRNIDLQEGKDQLEYPHIYYMKNEDNQTVLVGIQQEPQGDILIFKEYQDTVIKYCENYLGYIEYKQNGKEFIAYDDGFPEYMENNFPQWVGRKKRKLLVFDYFSEKRYDKPRLFNLQSLNLNTNNYDEILTQEPHYNEQKYSFSLQLGHIAEVPSTRNYVLIRKQDADEQKLFRHGKVNRHTFNLQIIQGLSVFQAFCISIVSICSKTCE